MSDASRQQIRDLIDRVRARWQRLMMLRAVVQAGLAGAGVLALAAFVLSRMTVPAVLAALGVIAVFLLVAAVGWGFRLLRRRPSDAQVARFIEESEPALGDRLVSAVALLDSDAASEPGFAAPMLADAARSTSTVEPAAVLTSETLRRAGFQAAAAVLLFAAVAFLGRNVARQSYDALAFSLFPSRLSLDVRPGNARIAPGAPLRIEARLTGNRAPIVARVLRADGDGGDDDVWRAADMAADPSGGFALALESVATSFKYKVTAGMLTSPMFEVNVTRPPRVSRIDIEYTYPSALGLEPRTEKDGGDIYAPAGSEARLRIYTDRAASKGQLALAGGAPVRLTPREGHALEGTLKVVADGSYRIALGDAEGFKNPGDTEYFIRVLEDRPPDVRVLRPARDRNVTRLEEVDIEAEAADDFGIDRLDLVYAVGGGPQRVVPFAVPKPAPSEPKRVEGRATSVRGTTTLYLEDLDVEPGDFVTYYVRARDLARGKRSSEARSDIFFLEVKPFEQEFKLAESQTQAGGDRQLDDLVAAQKEIIVATWKLDRRTQTAGGAKPEQDIKSVGRAESELKARVEQTSSSFRASTMRDPRGRGLPPGRGGAPSDALRAGQTSAEEDAMTAASAAMGKAVTALDALRTSDAIAPEMDALTQLMKAQADVKERQVTRQAAGGAGSNRTTQDLSSLFDRELQRQQQTNYETPTNTEQRKDSKSELLDKIKELARRQDELAKQQRDLARERPQLTPEEVKRRLERLTRDQSDLRDRADDLARQFGQQEQSGQQNQSGQNQSGQQSARQQSGQQPSGQQSGQQQSGPQSGSQTGQQAGQQQGSGQQRPGSQSAGGRNGQELRAASEEMRNAAGDLRREDPAQASERGARALERLRAIERELQGGPDEGRRARGDLQLEARQLADRQREIESEMSRLGQQGDAAKDAMRRLAGEEDRLAERAKALQQGLNRQAAGAKGQEPATERAIGEASREFNQQRVGERMQQSADQMRAAAGAAGRGGQNPDRPPQGSDRNQRAATERDVARALDDLADRLASADGPRDGTSRKLSEQLARTQELRERLDELTRDLEQLGQSGQPSPASRGVPGRPNQGTPGDAAAAERLREEYNRKLRQTRELLSELQRDDNTFAQGGPGFTFEGQGMVLSAPGTEAFKQDFTKWEALRKQATQALERAESSIAKRLQDREIKDRLAAGVDDLPPAGYQQQVDSYFKALASKKNP